MLITLSITLIEDITDYIDLFHLLVKHYNSGHLFSESIDSVR